MAIYCAERTMEGKGEDGGGASQVGLSQKEKKM